MKSIRFFYAGVYSWFNGIFTNDIFEEILQSLQS